MMTWRVQLDIYWSKLDNLHLILHKNKNKHFKKGAKVSKSNLRIPDDISTDVLTGK